MIFKLR